MSSMKIYQQNSHMVITALLLAEKMLEKIRVDEPKKEGGRGQDFLFSETFKTRGSRTSLLKKAKLYSQLYPS